MVSRLEYSISKTWDTHRELSRKNVSYPYIFIKLYFSHGSQTVRTLSFQDSVSHPRGWKGGGGTLGISGWGCAAGKNVIDIVVHLYVCLPRHLMAMPCWWAPIRAKQLSMADTAWIWPCACTRYWPGQYLSQCLNEHLRMPLSQQERGKDPGNEVA